MNKSNPIWNIFGQTFSLLGLLISIKLITNYVKPIDYGIYTIYFSIVVFLKNLSVQPAIQTILKFFPEFNIDENGFNKFNQLIRKPVYFFVMIFIIFLIAGIFFQNDYLINFSLIICAFITDSIRDYLRAIQNALKNFRKMSFLTLIPSYLKGIMGVILYIKFPYAESLLLGFIIANFITLIFFGLNDTFKLLQFSKNYTLDIHPLKKFITPLIPHKISSWFFMYIDKYLLLFFLGPTVVGLYTPIYNLLYQIYWLIHETITLNFRPYYYDLVQKSKFSDAFKIFNKNVYIAVSIYLVIVLIFISPLKDLTSLLLSNEYLAYIHLSPLLCLSFSMQMIGYIYETIFYGTSKTSLIFKIQFSVGIILFVLSAFLMQKFDVIGLIIALIICNLIFVIISTFFANKIKIEKNSLK